MALFSVPVQIVPREGILDPQGNAVEGALRSLGFADVKDVRVGRFIIVHVTADAAADATARVSAMCDKLLANPVTEDYRIEEPQLSGGAAS